MPHSLSKVQTIEAKNVVKILEQKIFAAPARKLISSAALNPPVTARTRLLGKRTVFSSVPTLRDVRQTSYAEASCSRPLRIRCLALSDLECECYSKNFEGVEGTLALAVSLSTVSSASFFRPVRSAERLVEAARDKELESVLSCTRDAGMILLCCYCHGFLGLVRLPPTPVVLPLYNIQVVQEPLLIPKKLKSAAVPFVSALTVGGEVTVSILLLVVWRLSCLQLTG